jgi:hypothetical protein
LKTQTICSLSAEPAAKEVGFDVCVFETDYTAEELTAFRAREEEFDLQDAVYVDEHGQTGSGLLCLASTDADYIARWGQDTFDLNYKQYGLNTIWHHATDSGVKPCSVYLRHCVLAVQQESVPERLRTSFFDETFLVDRTTTVRQYLSNHPSVMDTVPPESLKHRYSG